eukprot:jgi/Chrpa1/10128/Chrysochromulina_OHIO_Genome00017041-RA
MLSVLSALYAASTSALAARWHAFGCSAKLFDTTSHAFCGLMAVHTPSVARIRNSSEAVSLRWRTCGFWSFGSWSSLPSSPECRSSGLTPLLSWSATFDEHSTTSELPTVAKNSEPPCTMATEEVAPDLSAPLSCHVMCSSPIARRRASSASFPPLSSMDTE